MIALWLDDIREPPDGWTRVKNFKEAQEFVIANPEIDYMSLDHDLGGCQFCYEVMETENDKKICAINCVCDCHLTGYDFVKWLAENNLWPKYKPRVHSANPVGIANMMSVINNYYNHDDEF